VEPLFISPITTDFPLLKQVFVADGEKVIMADDLSKGLSLLVGEQVLVGGIEEPPPETVDPGSSIIPTFPIKALGEVQDELGNIEGAVADLKKGLETLEEALESIDETLRGASQ
jgi:uncharacterized membrane protein (UPF0182 family)